ncbi:PsiF family protein [Thauera sp. WH-1]|uniref:PsiF family protein n=1 Tax=Thauera sp. WH-1 TaxID=3398230 RepID=UPI0039FCA746
MKTILCATAATLAMMMLVPAEAMANPQHERMKRCNAEAREQQLKGDERKAFMSGCLKGRHDAGAAKPATEAGAGAPAVQSSPVSGAAVPAVVAAADEEVDDKARTRACNQAATEQSLKGAKRKAFLSECMKG